MTDWTRFSNPIGGMRTFKGGGALTPVQRKRQAQLIKIYNAAIAADDRFSLALQKQYGSAAGDMRYRKLPADLKALHHKAAMALDRYREAAER